MQQHSLKKKYYPNNLTLKNSRGICCMRYYLILLSRFFALLLLFTTTSTWAATTTSPSPTAHDFSKTVAAISQQGQTLVDQYTPAHNETAILGFYNIYYDLYEGSGMENAVAALSPSTNIKTEGLFAKLSGLASHQAPVNELKQTLATLTQQLQIDLSLLQSKNSSSQHWQAGLQSFIILLREGFEAMLIVTALLTYLRRSGHSDKTGVIYLGVAIALVASFATAYLFSTLFQQAGAHREAIEGGTMLLASAILLYVSYWLISKRQAADWQGYLKKKLTHAVGTGSLLTLGFAAFLAVYREGAETILFYQALTGLYQGEAFALTVGFMAACVALMGIYWVMQQATLKIPYQLFFSVTALFLYYMAFMFVGGGIRELQEAALISMTPLSGIPELPWLGIYPSLQSITAQMIFLVPTIGGMAWWWLRRMHPRKAAT
jgi:high-affinity iron transporter